MVRVDRTELIRAFEFANFGGVSEMRAFVSVATGQIYLWSDDLGFKEDAPDDLETSDDYLSLPDKKDLDLGRNLAFAFVQETLPDEWSTVRAFFGRAGAYARFKDLLTRHNMLDAWHTYEEAKAEEALRAWCAGNGLEMSDAHHPTA